MLCVRVHAVLYGSIGSHSLELPALSPFHASSNTHLYLVLVGLSQQPHCFVLKVHFYFAFKWMEMQMYAVLWVGGETDTAMYCPLRGQGAL